MNALKIYRISRWLYLHKNPVLSKTFSYINVFLYACKIPTRFPIGKGTKFSWLGFDPLDNPQYKRGISLLDRRKR